MKKTIAFIALLALITSMTGCGSVEEDISVDSAVTVTTNNAAVTAEKVIVTTEKAAVTTGTATVTNLSIQTTAKSNIMTTTQTTSAADNDAVQQSSQTESNKTENQNNSAVSNDNTVTPAPDTLSTTTKPNKYGFYLVETPIYTSISVAALGGEWILAGPTDNTLKVYSSEDDIYNGTWEYGTDGNVLNRGYVKLEYYIDSDGLSHGRTNFYENDGTLWESLVTNGAIQSYDIFGESGKPHYILSDYFDAKSVKGDAYIGRYGSNKQTMDIETEAKAGVGRYIISVYGPSSAAEYYTYRYYCYFDEYDNAFRSDYGTLTIETYTSENADPEVKTIYNKNAVFYAGDDGITWDDYSGIAENNILFTKLKSIGTDFNNY